MTERVKQLIENLRFTKDPFGYACAQLGFDEDDLSKEEIDSITEVIFQCGYCDRWEPIDESRYTYEFGFVCGRCYEELIEGSEN